MTLKEQLKNAFPELTERDFGSWQTDLYVVAYPKVVQWLKDNYQFYTNIQHFIGQKGADWNGAGKSCLDIPFANQ
jgi:hypothetical protein